MTKLFYYVAALRVPAEGKAISINPTNHELSVNLFFNPSTGPIPQTTGPGCFPLNALYETYRAFYKPSKNSAENPFNPA